MLSDLNSDEQRNSRLDIAQEDSSEETGARTSRPQKKKKTN
jgi:hypothetical protein